MKAKQQSPARIWVLLAREAPMGVIFRRGPSKQVLLIKWDTRRNVFEVGQWFKGRIYERRSDLSPDGSLLIYFAGNQARKMQSWTAVSRPPYFTALALWPKGDCWNGGGWFLDKSRIRLNHFSFESQLDPRFAIGPLKVAEHAEFRGEDATVHDFVLRRDGWDLIEEGEAQSRGCLRGWSIQPPQRWAKPHPKRPEFTLHMDVVGIGGRNAPWYQLRFEVLSRGEVRADLGQADWADWDHRGHLVFAKRGCLFRQRFARSLSATATQIADFNGLKFTQVAPPSEARSW